MIGMNLKYLRKSTDIHRRTLRRGLRCQDSLLQSGKTRNLFPMSKMRDDGADFETTVEMLLVCPFTRKNLTHSLPTVTESTFSALLRSAKEDRLHSLNTPERCLKLRQATDFWFSVTRKRYGTCKIKIPLIS